MARLAELEAAREVRGPATLAVNGGKSPRFRLRGQGNRLPESGLFVPELGLLRLDDTAMPEVTLLWSQLGFQDLWTLLRSDYEANLIKFS